MTSRNFPNSPNSVPFGLPEISRPPFKGAGFSGKRETEVQKPTPRDLAALRIRLVSAIEDTCALRNDPPGNAAELIREITSTLSYSQQLEMLEHFEQQRRIWIAACGQQLSSTTAGHAGNHQ